MNKRTERIGQNLLERFFVHALSATQPTTLEYDEERGCLTAYYGDPVSDAISPDGKVTWLQESINKTIFVITALVHCNDCQSEGHLDPSPAIIIYGGFNRKESTFGRGIEEFECPDGTTYGDSLMHIHHLVYQIRGKQLDGCHFL